MTSPRLTHIDDAGNANMVDVSAKDVTTREATASGSIFMEPDTLEMIEAGTAKKGDVIATARIAGIMAAKRTHELIPLCHPLAISRIALDIFADKPSSRLDVTATVKVEGKTGVEMEALTAVTVACLTLYDMTKAVDRAMRISDIRLTHKTGGKSGDFRAA